MLFPYIPLYVPYTVQDTLWWFCSNNPQFKRFPGDLLLFSHLRGFQAFALGLRVSWDRHGNVLNRVLLPLSPYFVFLPVIGPSWAPLRLWRWTSDALMDPVKFWEKMGQSIIWCHPQDHHDHLLSLLFCKYADELLSHKVIEFCYKECNYEDHECHICYSVLKISKGIQHLERQ